MERNEVNDLEEAFFAEQNKMLLDELRKKTETEERREALRRIVKIKDDAFIDRLIALDIGPEKALALRLVPLIFVAWADGHLDEREREAVLRAAKEEGLADDAMAAGVLGSWLAKPPEPHVLELWKDYIREIWSRFSPDEQWQMRQNLLGAARGVASAAGGFLGLAKISSAEQAVLDDLQRLVE